jgi:hypothetical protein
MAFADALKRISHETLWFTPQVICSVRLIQWRF